MSKTLNFLPAVVLSLCVALPIAVQAEPKADTIVAIVNGEEITLGHMILVRDGLSDQYKALPDELLFSGILDQLVQQTLLSQTLEGALPRRISLALENEERSLKAADVIGSVLSGATTEEALQEAYELQYGGTSVAREYQAAHILVETIEEAQDLIKQLEEGVDFAKLARDNSTGPSGPNGGDLGWFGLGQMVKPFEDAVIALATGDVSEPVQTQFGWHVIKLNENRIMEAPQFNTVRDELAEGIQEKAVKIHIDSLLNSGVISRPGEGTINPALLKKIDILEN